MGENVNITARGFFTFSIDTTRGKAKTSTSKYEYDKIAVRIL